MTTRILALLAILTVSGAAASRDWSKSPAVIEVDTRGEIFAVGDAHGDVVRLSAVLRGAGIIDTNGNWIAGNAVLVTTGDMIDKGPKALDVIQLLATLRNVAPSKGGQVIILAGNHEAEFMADPAASKVKEFAAELKARGLDPAGVSNCNSDVGKFLCTLPFAARVNKVFFSHAGSTNGRTIAQLEADIEKDFNQHGFKASQLTGDGSLIEARLNGTGKGRDVWIDAGLPARSEKQLLFDNCKALGVAHIVEGHVPSEVKFADGVKRGRGEMFQRYGLLFLIDTGLSEGVDDSIGAALHITPDNGFTASAVCPDGSATLLWDAAAKQDLGRAKRCGKE